MITTKNFASDKKDIKSSWVFEYYLDLPERLTGQDVKIKSIFNANDKSPSMFIYLDTNRNEYRYKDFSTGNQGSKVDIVQALFDLSYSQALFRIVEDHNTYIRENGTMDDIEYVPVAKYQVDYIKNREWTENDAEYWLQYNIGTTLLNTFNVKPIEYYTMVKENVDDISKITITNLMIYGYYDKHGDIYKIYQPKQKKRKFIKTKKYLQGLDQLTYNKKYLVICSSLKDALCVLSFNLGVEVIAPDSENTMIKPYIIQNLLSKYKKVVCLLDNDEAGLIAMEKYKKIYKIDSVHLKSEKDISDAVAKYGAEAVKPKLFKLIKEKI
tara:strand:+ start:671 stop:1645 length:975 start_codon:yes stop_codon:yes gene_type:complete